VCRVDVLERLQLGALEPDVRVRVVLRVPVVRRGCTDCGRRRRRGRHRHGSLMVVTGRLRLTVGAADRLDVGRMLDQSGPGQQAGGRRCRTDVLQVVVHNDARLGVVAAAETRRGRSPAPMLHRLLFVAVVVRRAPQHRRRPAASVHYRLGVVVVAGAGYVDVPARGHGKLLVGHGSASRRLVIVVVVIVVVVVLLQLLLFFRFRGVHVHQRPVLPHGHSGQQPFVGPSRLLKLPHGLCPLDLLSLRGEPVVVVVVVSRISLPGLLQTVAERRQVSDASALPHHRRRARIPPSGVHPSAAAVVRRLQRARRLSATAAAAIRHRHRLVLMMTLTVVTAVLFGRPVIRRHLLFGTFLRIFDHRSGLNIILGYINVR